MARRLHWLLLLTVLVAADAFVMSAEGWMPSFVQKSNQDMAKGGAEQTVVGSKSWTNWAAGNIPYFSSSAAKETNDKLDASKDSVNVAAEGEKSARTAAETASEYATKGLERVTSTKEQLHEAGMGLIQRWGSWAKDSVGKYTSYGPLTTERATDTVNSASSNGDSAADNTKEYVQADEVVGNTDEKEL